MISGFGTVDSAVQALHLGADDFVTKPVDPDVLSHRVADLLERRPGAELTESTRFGEMIGHSAVMRKVFELLRRVAPTEATVLVTGETGTGKELAVQAVHALSPRSRGPFVAVNCASLAEGVLESELFGHVRGAFTGAVQDKPGLFEAAEKGTLFLDEIGDVTPGLQQRLLRVIQEREIRRVGSVSSKLVDVRLVAATSRDLRRDVVENRFREDLFYRLNVFPVHLPPLRERRSDIPPLVEKGLDRIHAARPQYARLTCSPFAMRMLRAYDWPGNVRELFAALERAAIRTDRPRIEAQHLPREIRAASGDSSEESRYRAEAVGDDERSAIVAALHEAEGSRTRAAELLGMGRTTLWRKMKAYGIDLEDDEPA
jgi:DNA-binding NtrC family response regulator